MVATVVKRFPVDVLDDVADYLFLPLVVRLVNDERASCRTAVGVALKALMSRIAPPAFNRLFGLVTNWLDGNGGVEDAAERRELKRAAVQVAGLAVDSRCAVLRKGKRLEPLIRQLHTVLLASWAAADDDAVDSEGEESEEEQVGEAPLTEWQTPYYTLLTLQKIVVHSTNARAGAGVILLPNGPRGEEGAPIAEVLVDDLLVHPHARLSTHCRTPTTTNH